MVKQWFKNYITENKRDIILVLTFLFIGMFIAVVAYFFTSNTVKELVTSNVKQVFEISKSEQYVKTNIILNGIKADIILIMLLGIFSAMLFGKALIYVTIMLKGMAVALYTIILFNIFGPLWGIVTVLLLVIFVNIIYLPALIYLIVKYLEINFNIFKAKIDNLTFTSFSKVLATIVVAFLLMLSSITIEQIVSPIVLNIYTKL